MQSVNEICVYKLELKAIHDLWTKYDASKKRSMSYDTV